KFKVWCPCAGELQFSVTAGTAGRQIMTRLMTPRRLLSTTGQAGIAGNRGAGRTRTVSESAMNMKPFWFGAGSAGNAGVLVRLGAIGAVMLGVAGAFAYVGGWLSPARLTQDRMMAAFKDAN